MLPAGWQPVEGRKVVVGKVPRPRSLPHASPLIHKDRNDRVEMYYELYGTGPEKVLLIMGVLPSPYLSLPQMAHAHFRLRDALLGLASHGRRAHASASEPPVPHRR